MMIRFLITVLPAIWLSTAGAATLDEVFSLIDKSSAGFQSMTASLTRVDHTAIIDDTSKESGRIAMRKLKPGDVRMLIEFTDPDERAIAFAERKVEIYHPKIKTVQVYDLGKYRNLVDQFLLLGFGSSSAELKKNYAVKLTGADQLMGITVSRLELTPKSAAAKEHLARVELWLNGEGYPVQQKFYRPSDDYTLVTYRDLKVNPDLPPSALALKLPAGVVRQYPQK